MNRYFFHLQDDDHPPDEIGMDLPDHAAAQSEAIRTMGEMLREQRTRRTKTLRMMVTDEVGLMLFLVDLSVVAAPAIAKQAAS